MIISHDRYFMDKLVDHIFILEGDGNIRDYNGNYTEYRLEKSGAKQSEDKPQPTVVKPRAGTILSCAKRLKPLKTNRKARKTQTGTHRLF